MWPVLDFNGDYEDEYEVARATQKAHMDPTDYGLAKLLRTDAHELTDGSIEFWLSLVFADYVRNSIVLPLEIDRCKLSSYFDRISPSMIITNIVMIRQ